MAAGPARMTGKCALVTGATGGLGRAISEVLHENGATVYLTDIDRDRGESLAQGLGDRARFVQLDVTDEESWAAAAARLQDAGDELTTLVNCAGAALRSPLVDTSAADFRRILGLNLTGTFLGIRMAGRDLVDGGSIVNISSLNGVLPTAGLGAYVASKAGVSALTRVAALELADRRITVNAVCPGSIDTAITDSQDFADTDWDAYVRSIPLGRRGAPLEVAQAVLYLASDEARYVTGTNLMIDGGISAGRGQPASLGRGEIGHGEIGHG
jgi:NAD(P)-dependent dehydrogenase (short-subunit alcohol dehydrogenase family)